MKEVVIAAAVLIGIGVVAKRLGAESQSMDWEQAFAAMPDNAPPKWMFRNITAIRENTGRVIELLEGSATGRDAEADPSNGAEREGANGVGAPRSTLVLRWL
jgi:hypothetical protein